MHARFQTAQIKRQIGKPVDPVVEAQARRQSPQSTHQDGFGRGHGLQRRIKRLEFHRRVRVQTANRALAQPVALPGVEHVAQKLAGIGRFLQFCRGDEEAAAAFHELAKGRLPRLIQGRAQPDDQLACAGVMGQKIPIARSLLPAQVQKMGLQPQILQYFFQGPAHGGPLLPLVLVPDKDQDRRLHRKGRGPDVEAAVAECNRTIGAVDAREDPVRACSRGLECPLEYLLFPQVGAPLQGNLAPGL